MTEARAAHFRLLESLPRECIRTHRRAEPQVDQLDPVGRYLELKKDGAKYLDIKRELAVSSDTLSKIAKEAAARESR